MRPSRRTLRPSAQHTRITNRANRRRTGREIAGKTRHETVVAWATAFGVLATFAIGLGSAWVAMQTADQQAAGQRADQFSNAIEQLGSQDASKSADVRLGGIYALGRLINDDPTTYRTQGCEVIGSYLNGRTPRKPTPKDPTPPPIGSDVRGAFTTLARSCAQEAALAAPNVNLERAYLVSTDLQRVPFRRAQLSEADLSEADLSEADLSLADLRGAHLRDAKLRAADLWWASLMGADLSSADLRLADLSSADLSGADLSWADLNEADLSWANLSESDLSGASLRGANLKGIVYDSETIWPSGFTPPPTAQAPSG